MDHISSFLSRYLSPYLKHEHTKETIAKVCSEELGVPILPTAIIVKKGSCTVSGSQSLKHQLFLHQEKLLEGIQKEGIRSIHSIQ